MREGLGGESRGQSAVEIRARPPFSEGFDRGGCRERKLSLSVVVVVCVVPILLLHGPRGAMEV